MRDGIVTIRCVECGKLLGRYDCRVTPDMTQWISCLECEAKNVDKEDTTKGSI
jgi:hypothetical protein